MPNAYCLLPKGGPALQTKNISLYIAVFLMEIGYGLSLLAASLIAVRVIPGPFVLGLTGTLHVATRIAGNVMFGRLSDRIGRKFLMLLACVLALAALAALQYPMIAFVFIAYFLSGVANSIFWPLAEAWIGHGSNREGLIKFMGLFGAVFTTGIALGSLLAGFFTNMSPLSILGLGACISWVSVDRLPYEETGP